MIQRIQTIYLLLVIICLGLAFVFPFADYAVGQETFTFNIFGLTIGDENIIRFPFYVSVALSIGLSIFSISKFAKIYLMMKPILLLCSKIF